MSTMGERLVEMRKDMHLSQRTAAKALGLTPSTLNMYEHDKRVPKQQIAQRLCILYKCDMNYLYGTQEVRSASAAIAKQTTNVMYYSFSAFRKGIVDANGAESAFSLPREFLPSDRFYFGTTVPDDAMSGASLHAGDLAIFYVSHEIMPHDTLLVYYRGKACIRRCQIIGQHCSKLIAYNEDYPDIDIGTDEEITILGKLIASISNRS